MAFVDRMLKGLYALCGALAAGCIALIAVLVLASVVSRLAGVYIGGLTSIAGYAMAAAGSLGLAYTFGSGGHIRVDLVLNALAEGPRRRLDQIALLATTASVGYLAYYLSRMVSLSWSYGDLSDKSDAAPLWIPQLPVAFGVAVFAISLLHSAVVYLATGRSPVPKPESGLISRDGR